MRASKRPQESEELYQEAARTTTKRLHYRMSPIERFWLGRACACLAWLRMDRCDWKAATPLMQQAVDHQRIAARSRWYLDLEYRENRLWLTVLLARLGEHQHAASLAEEMLREAIRDGETDVAELNFLSRCIQLVNQDARLDAAERERLVQGHLLRMRQLLKGAVQPTVDPNTLNALAWFLATTPCTEFQDPHRAVELARQAVAHATDNAVYQNTLGVALFRAGDWGASRDALCKSIDLGNGGDSSDFFFLAMAHWQLGERDKAKEWHEKAIAWMHENKPQDEELLRFRAEAAVLLGKQDREGLPPK
jgi:tetratricopeptide (TPR) repeat protein